ncbi:MAG: patatin family protein [Clostridia bacterium]|nr:patatin family protein [Clostridia bacterium]
MAKQYSGVSTLRKGDASDEITEGCLILEGGAFRGLYTSGALDAFMEEDLNMSCSVGISAGSLNGMNYISGQIGRSGRMNLQYRHDGRYCGFRALVQNKGVIGFKFIYGTMPNVEDFNGERFYSRPMKFYAQMASLETGGAEYVEKNSGTDIWQAVRASSSMPYVSKKVIVDGKPYLDGGCACKVPVDWGKEHGYDKTVIIRTRERGWRYPVKDKPSKMPYRFYRKYPEFAESLATTEVRHNEACARMEQMHDNGEIFVLWPSEHVTVSRLEKDMEKLGALYWLGYNDAKAAIPAIKEFLGAK